MSAGDIERQVRKLVGIAALRRLRQVVDSEIANDAQKTIWARRLGNWLTGLAVLLIIGLVLAVLSR